MRVPFFKRAHPVFGTCFDRRDSLVGDRLLLLHQPLCLLARVKAFLRSSFLAYDHLLGKLINASILLLDFDLLGVELLFYFLQGCLNADSVSGVHQFDQSGDTFVCEPPTPRSSSQTCDAVDGYRLALLECVGTVLRFAFVEDTVAATKDTRDFFNEAMCSMTDDVIVLYCLDIAGVHGALYLDFVQLILEGINWSLTFKLVLFLGIWADLTFIEIIIDAWLAEQLTAL